MVAKRPAPATQSAKDKAAPKAKAAKVEKEVVEPFFEECAPVRDLIGEASDLPGGCIEMLQAMAHHCLKTAKAERTEQQETMAGILAEVADSVEAQRRAAVGAAETQVTETGTEKATADETLKTVEASVAERREEREVRNAAMKANDEASETAKTTLESARVKEAAMAEEHKENVAEKAAFEVIMTEKWAPVRDGLISGSNWRERNKAIDAALQPLEKLNLDGSLMDALPVALKTKVDNRGSFALEVLKYGEGAFTKHLETLSEKISSVDAETAKRQQAAAEAEAALKTAEEQQEASRAELQAAEEALAAEEQGELEAAEAVSSRAKKTKTVAKALQNQQAQLANVLELAAKLQALKEQPPPAEAAVEEEAVEPAPMAVDAAPALVEAM